MAGESQSKRLETKREATAESSGELAEIREQYRLITETSFEGIAIIDPEGEFYWMNPAAAHLFGAESPGDLVGTDLFSLVTPESRGVAVADMTMVFDGAVRTSLEYQIRTAAGRTIWVEVFARPTHHEGKPAVLLTLHDTTDRHTKDAELQESQRTLFTLMSNLPGMAYRRLNDSDWTMEFVSEGCFSLTGYHSAELYRSRTVSYAAIIHPDDRANVQGEVTAAVLEKRPFQMNYRILTRAGDEKWVWERGRPIAGPDGALIALEGFVADITEQRRMEQELRENLRRRLEALEGMVEAIGTIVEKRDPYTAGHERRVAKLACAIAQAMGMTEDFVKGLRLASLIHDIGKISVPSEILSKPSTLTDLEYGIIKTHTTVGHECLANLEFPWPIAEVVLQHHERMDGSGYPRGLMGDRIIMEARILAVADTVESIASHRPYRPAFGLDVALQAIEQNTREYDPAVVQACAKIFREGGFSFA